MTYTIWHLPSHNVIAEFTSIDAVLSYLRESALEINLDDVAIAMEDSDGNITSGEVVVQIVRHETRVTA